MPTDPDISCISAAINNDPSVFLPMLLAYIENSVYNKVNEEYRRGSFASSPVLFCVLFRSHHLCHEAAHGLRGLVPCIGAQGKTRVAAIRHAADGFYFLKNATTTAPGPACVPITLPTVV